MKTWSLRALLCAVLAPGSLLVASPADAVVPIWEITTVLGGATGIVREGAPVTVSANCPTGSTLISGHVEPSLPDDVRRIAETLGPSGYSAMVEDQSGGPGSITVRAVARCVPSSYFSAPPVVINTQATDLDDNDHVILVGATCPANYKALKASTSFTSSSTGRTVLTSTPTANQGGWEARGWVESSSNPLKLSLTCVAAVDMAGAKTYAALDTVGWGATADVDCPSGMVPITGGTIHIAGDGGAVTVNERPTASGWTSTTLSLSTGAMQSLVVCLPGSNPSVQISGPSGLINTSSVSWSFTATDPAAAGGYSVTTTCKISHPGSTEGRAPCTSPLSRSGLAEGDHQITVVATTSDGRTGSASRSIRADTIAPVVAFADPQSTFFATASRTIGFSVSDASPVGNLTCWADDAAPAPCPVGTVSDYRGAWGVQLIGGTDGPHVLHVKPTDAATNTATYDLAFTVDTIDPVVTFADPQNTFVATGSPTIDFSVSDASPVGTLACWVDAAAPAPCPVATVSDYRGARSVQLTGLGDGPHVLHVKPTDAATNTAVYDLAFTVDTQAPSVAMSKPNQSFQMTRSVGVAWSGQDALSGIEGYSLRRRRAPYNAGFGAWSASSTLGPGTTSTTFGSLAPGTTQCFQVTANDQEGNVSAASSRCTAIPLDDRSLDRSTGWTRETRSGWFQGTALSTKRKGASLSKAATLKRVGLIVQRCPTCGVVGIYTGATQVGRINLRSTTTARVLITLPPFSLRAKPVRVKVLSSGKLVRIDALGVSRS